MGGNEFLLDMRRVSKEFPGVKALDKVDFKLRPGSVHALVGENGAGKSTLMKCLFGIYKMDAGQIFFQGESVDFSNPKQALDNGVAMVHQELNQVMYRNVMDNIWLGRYPEKGLIVDERTMYRRTKEILEGLGINIDPRSRVNSLSVSERQMVEIAKAVSYNSRILVLDEPTSSLTEKEVEHLFSIINRLKADGCGIIYISHKMEEIFEIADEITILRDGQWIGTEPVHNLDMDKIIHMMVGRELVNRFPTKTNVPGEPIFKVKNYTAFYQPSFKNVSFELREGEILGIAGLMGSKRTELVEAIFGIRRVESGKLKLHGRTINNNNPREAIKNGFSLITEERRHNGIFPCLNILSNSIIANIDSYTNPLGVLNGKKTTSDTNWVIKTLDVRTPSHRTEIQDLSGGNQQKVIIGRWMLTESSIFLMDEPTRGIDVGAKREIYQLMIDLACEGKSVIMVSSEMPELLGVCDRILVMSNGRLAGIVNAKETSQEEIMELASKYL